VVVAVAEGVRVGVNVVVMEAMGEGAVGPGVVAMEAVAREVLV
jgi:hypothetical protein